uniref:Protein NATD1 n=1 Tax=Crocodylus porosus TaxID=8502 RepID=A0A7M4FEH6_CROPO
MLPDPLSKSCLSSLASRGPASIYHRRVSVHILLMPVESQCASAKVQWAPFAADPAVLQATAAEVSQPARAWDVHVSRVGSPSAGGSPERFKHFTLALRSTGCHDKAVLLYEYVGKRIVDLQHTEVPDAYRGRGIAKHLAKAALDFVVEEDLKAHLTCWYIQKYVKENPLPQYLEHLQP